MMALLTSSSYLMESLMNTLLRTLPTFLQKMSVDEQPRPSMALKQQHRSYAEIWLELDSIVTETHLCRWPSSEKLCLSIRMRAAEQPQLTTGTRSMEVPVAPHGKQKRSCAVRHPYHSMELFGAQVSMLFTSSLYLALESGMFLAGICRQVQVCVHNSRLCLDVQRTRIGVYSISRSRSTYHTIHGLKQHWMGRLLILYLHV
mmetsp:Transcript_66276/g.104855  ORF Transcript_66276/g.104855 Transcript_66276/m.104855 type:complete len:202 (+) Transcript_66276:32-637(+)